MIALIAIANLSAAEAFRIKTYNLHQNASLVEGGDYRDHAWTNEQHANSNVGEWDAETKKQTLGRYNAAQAPNYRNSAWTDEQNENSNSKEWNAETQKQTAGKYNAAQKLTYPSKDSDSYVEPYVVRDHAWSNDQFQSSNSTTWANQTQKDTLGRYNAIQISNETSGNSTQEAKNTT